jgi:hypothetical protein
VLALGLQFKLIVHLWFWSKKQSTGLLLVEQCCFRSIIDLHAGAINFWLLIDG